MDVALLLTELLRATAAKTAAGRRVERLRERLDTEARRRYAAENAAPSWKAPSLGTVRLDPKDAEAYVADDDAFASYVAERFPTEVEATVLLPAAELEAALAALAFAGVTVHRSEARVRPSFTKALLADAEVLYDAEEPANSAVMRVLDTEAGTVEPIAGTGVLPPNATLVVTLDRDAKARTLAAVDRDLDVELGSDAGVVTLAEAVELSAQPAASPIPRAGEVGGPPAPPNLTIGAGGGGTAVGGTMADQQRAAAQAHAATIGERLKAFADTGQPPPVGPAPDDGLEPTPNPDLGEVLLEELNAPRDPTGERLDRHREPYVGEGADGARRSAAIDRSELDGMAADDPLRPEREASADAWDRQAEDLDRDARLEAAVRMTGEEPDPDLVEATRHVDDLGGSTAIDELAKLGSDDLKRAARLKRVPVSGTKVLLAARLAKAGVTVDDVLAARPRVEA